MIKNIFTLDHAPIVGKKYLVPTIDDYWQGPGIWPLITPAPHSENPETGFWDWHLDYRFFTRRQEMLAERCEKENPNTDPMRPPAKPEARWTGSRASRQFTIGRFGQGSLAFPTVKFRPLRCRRPTVAPEPLCVPFDLCEFGSPATAIQTADGRYLCPHQKMDLTHWPREADGTVICPLHRLKVRIAA